MCAVRFHKINYTYRATVPLNKPSAYVQRDGGEGGARQAHCERLQRVQRADESC
jgi:hypothetical protein